MVAHSLGAVEETDSAAPYRRCGGEQGETRDFLARHGLDRGHPGVDGAPKIDARVAQARRLIDVVLALEQVLCPEAIFELNVIEQLESNEKLGIGRRSS